MNVNFEFAEPSFGTTGMNLVMPHRWKNTSYILPFLWCFSERPSLVAATILVRCRWLERVRFVGLVLGS